MEKSEQNRQELLNTLNNTFEVFDRVLKGRQYDLKAREMGIVQSVSEGIAHIQGLPSVKPNELIRLPLNKQGFAFNLDEGEVGIVLLDKSEGISAGSEVYRTGRFLDVPVGEELLGRIIDPLGRPLDDQGPLGTKKRSPIEREAPPIMARAPVNVPLQTGLQVVDALIPIGRGQRELILGDRQTGKTAIALDTIINQKKSEVKCIYCAIGQRSSSVAKLIADLRKYQALDYCVVIFATGENTPGLNFIAPYAATAVAEYFMHQGSDALIIYDDLTRHARAYRELSLLLRRPPAREAYPGDIFYIHSRLLERATHLGQEHGGGSLTALPIIETQAQNLSAYIPTNLISITDGQIYLSPGFHQRGILPAVDVGKSVSRVGGKTQLPAYRAVAGDLRLSYSQFEELESFARFGTKLDEHTQKILVRGRRIREILKQSQYHPLSVPEQISVLLSVTEGLLDDLPLDKIDQVKREIRKAVREQPRMTGIAQRIQSGQKLCDDDHEALVEIAAQSIRAYLAEDTNEVHGNLTKKD